MSIISFPTGKRTSQSNTISFEEFYEKYSSEILFYLIKKTGNKEAAEDLASEAFLYCYEHFDSYDPNKSAISTWLYLVVNSRLKNYYRNQKETVDLSELEEFLFDDQPDLNKAVYLEEMRNTLAVAIKSLSEMQQKVIIMRFFGHREFDEIAQELGTSSGNVRVIQTRALSKLCKECQTLGLSVEDLEE